MWNSERTTNRGKKDPFSPLFNSPSYAPTRRERRRVRAQPLNPRHEFQKAVYTAHDQRVAVVRVARSGRGETATSRAYSGGSDSRVPLPDPHVYAYKRSGTKKRYTMRNKSERRVACRESKSGNLDCGNRGAWRGKIRFWIARFDLAWAGESVYSAGKMQLDGVTVAYWRGDATRATRGTPRKLKMRAHRAPPSEPTRKASFTIRFAVDLWDRGKYIFFLLTMSFYFLLFIDRYFSR